MKLGPVWTMLNFDLSSENERFLIWTNYILVVKWSFLAFDKDYAIGVETSGR